MGNIVTANEKVAFTNAESISSHSLTRDAVLNLEAAYTDSLLSHVLI
jgi:hypothetical protein